VYNSNNVWVYGDYITGWWFQPPLKNISQIGSSSQLSGKIKNAPNHQPDQYYIYSLIMLKRTGWVYGEYPPGIAQLFLDGL